VTFAPGMAAEGVKPFCAIYSTFLQAGAPASRALWREIGPDLGFALIVW
jgi:hypothetical protein